MVHLRENRFEKFKQKLKSIRLALKITKANFILDHPETRMQCWIRNKTETLNASNKYVLITCYEISGYI